MWTKISTVLSSSLGAIDRCRRQASEALAVAHEEAREAVVQAESKHIDETGRKQSGQRHWLWAAVSGTVALFVIHAKRGLAGLQSLMGEAVGWVVISDRWCAYTRLKARERQLCWAHLKRDFQAMVDRDNAGREIGEELLTFCEDVFTYWHRFGTGRWGEA